MARPTRYTPEMIEEYTRKGYWTAGTLSTVCRSNARAFPDREALVDSRTRLTWGQVDDCVDSLALGLIELGFRKDDLIVTQLPNFVELYLWRVASERAGLLWLPVLRSWRQKEMETLFRSVRPAGVAIPRTFRDFDHFAMINALQPATPGLKHILVVGDEVPAGGISVKEILRKKADKTRLPSLLRDRECASTEFSLVLPTTGTTGYPRFVEHPICSRLNLGRAYVDIFGVTTGDIVAALTPASGGPNMAAYVAAPLVGAKIVMEERFEPEEALRLIEREKVTIACAVPAQLAMMVQHPRLSRYDLRSVRLWHSGGAYLPYEIGLEVEEKMGGKVVQSLGAVDWGSTSTTPPEASRRVRLTTVGKPVPGTDLKVVDEAGRELPRGEVGEIMGRGAGCASGYFLDPQATCQAWTAGGWIRLGDLGKFDDEGNLMVMGRKKDIIIRGGQNIYPGEVENILAGHPAVSSAALAGYPDAVMGERVCAFVVVRPGRRFTFEDMVAFLKANNIASYKLPERLELLEQMPLAGEQKIDKKALRQKLASKMATPDLIGGE
ncbi:MAG: AMP-binding protein [Chloroflexi bacterium]|nr:AMP-binding protein [Chloroflexota bacterium]